MCNAGREIESARTTMIQVILIFTHAGYGTFNPDRPEDGYVWLYEDVTDRRQAVDSLTAVLHEQTLIFGIGVVDHDIDVTRGGDIGETVGDPQHGVRDVSLFVEVHNPENEDFLFCRQISQRCEKSAHI